MNKNVKSLLSLVLGLLIVAGFMCFESWIFMLIANWVFSLLNFAFAFTFPQAFGVCLLLSFVGGFFKKSSK